MSKSYEKMNSKSTLPDKSITGRNAPKGIWAFLTYIDRWKEQLDANS